MTLTRHQANFLYRLVAACDNAENFTESIARQERLDKYMDHLIEQGIDSQEIADVLY